MPKKIFVSHSHPDKPLVDALKKLIESIFKNSVLLSISSEKAEEEGVEAGEEWKKWIHEKITECDIMLVVMTPYSVQRPWVMIEVGFAQGKDKVIVPILFGLGGNAIPPPLQDLQAVQGDEKQDVLRVLKKFRSTLELQHDVGFIDDPVKEYLKSIKKALAKYPKSFTQDELVTMATGPLGLVIKQGMKLLKKR
jgi:hypothetical protein